jgi:uncharacterized RDD family membrane protein YckC
MNQQPPVQQPGGPAAWAPPPAAYPPPGYPPVAYAAAPRYAGFWIRFVAAIIDGVIMAILFITIIGGIIYLPLMWWKKGQTVGMMALNIKIVRAVDGGPIGGQAAFVRFVVYIIEGILSYIIIGLLGFIWAAFDARKQAWHDKAAGTVVIHTN